MAWINLLDCIYPIGSLYFSNNSTSPASIIGGSWTKIEDAVVRSSTSVGYIGSDTHTLTKEEMPAHNHVDGRIRGGTGNDAMRSAYSQLNGTTSTHYAAWFGSGYKGVDNVRIQTEGGGESHSIVQRSYNCFIWYRTA